MYLTTNDLLVPVDAAMNHVEPVNPVGWREVCKGLYGILAGYLLIVGTVVGAVILVLVMLLQMAPGHGHKAAGDAFATLIVGALVFGLLILGAYALIVRNEWRCLRNAPEQCGAKWWMFAAMLCLVAGPVLGSVSSLMGSDDQAAAVRLIGQKGAPLTMREALAESRKAGAAAAPMQIVSSAIGLLSQVFFVLFLRSIALAFNDGFRARFAEMYLLLTGVLFAGLVGFILVPEHFLARPMLLLLMGGGWALSGLWYLALIVSTCACIHKNLAVLRSAPASD